MKGPVNDRASKPKNNAVDALGASQGGDSPDKNKYVRYSLIPFANNSIYLTNLFSFYSRSLIQMRVSTLLKKQR